MPAAAPAPPISETLNVFRPLSVRLMNNLLTA